MTTLESNWEKTLNIFGHNFEDKVIFESIITLLKAQEVNSHELIATIEAEFNVPIVSEYANDLEKIYNEITDSHVKLTIMSEEAYLKQHASDNTPVHFEDHLRPDFTFTNFVVGNSNRIAQNASLAVAMKPGAAYSPLFIYSNSGLGKTHLLNAIGNYIKEKKPHLQVLYSTSEQFVNDYISSLSNHTINDFNFRYRNVDVLLIDDIQFIATKESSSEMFFNIFNALQNDNKQIVISSDKPPKDLKGMENRLVSRFTNGLTVSIDTPEFETAKAILRKKIEIEKVDYPIDEEVLDFIASHFNRDVRELEGSLKRLFFYKVVTGQEYDHINMECALEAFKEDYHTTVNTSKNEELSVDKIKKVVAEYYNLSVQQINSKSRTSNLIVARHIAMYLVRNLIESISYIQIGKEFGGRDHSTVMKACDKVEKNMKKDPNYRKAVEEIKSKLV